MAVVAKASTAALLLLAGGALQPRLYCTVATVTPARRGGVSLTTECQTDGSSAHYEETLSGSGSTMIRNTVSGTGCPNHVNWAINPNSARISQSHPSTVPSSCRSQYISSDANIPAYPMFIDSSSGTTDLRESAGAVGVMLNGVSLFSAWAGDGVADSYESSATYLEGDTFDLCGGHATATGWYHYHNTAGCLQEQDGFPIYGQLGPNGVEMLMCGNEGANDAYCLDLCNGYEGELDGIDDFKYRYYLSCGFDELYFPLTTNCYRGCCPSGISNSGKAMIGMLNPLDPCNLTYCNPCGRNSCEGHLDNCGSSATVGYTSDYTPEALLSLDGIYDSELISGDDTNMIDTDNSMDCSLYMGSYGATDYEDDDEVDEEDDDEDDDEVDEEDDNVDDDEGDDEDDDEDGDGSGAARCRQSIKLVGVLYAGVVAAAPTAIMALHNNL